MEIILTDHAGNRYTLPGATAWEFLRTGGTPCDSFMVRFPLTDTSAETLTSAVRLTAAEDGVTRFSGVVDDFELTQDRNGRTAEITGRGLAALLLDNEAVPRQYLSAALSDLLRFHVAPYGIKTAGTGPRSSAADFTVESGMSEWDVLVKFYALKGAPTPFFTADGTLRLDGRPVTAACAVDAKTPVTRAVLTGQRYGVLSEALVRDRYTITSVTVQNAAFLREGGCRRAVYTMPGRSDGAAMRAQGQSLLDASMTERETAEITIPAAFFADAGEAVRLAPQGLGELGLFRVTESLCAFGAGGVYTRLKLRRED